ncbi:hypothetical protein LTS15_004614 [Exophiala xenobiotica]|nr:hypothetical protein LTS15_004614 [Exophiala xenobiotica]
MQPYVKKLDVFVRTGIWFFSWDGRATAPEIYPEETKKEFRESHETMLAHCKRYENELMGLFNIMLTHDDHHGDAQRNIRKKLAKRMSEYIKDPRLVQGFTPQFSVGCKRIAPGDTYMDAIQKPNVEVHFTGVQSVIEDGLVGDDGSVTKVDTIVCATGFNVSHIPRFPIIGLNGADLGKKWAVIPEGYYGLACPEFPNYIIFQGPTWPVENGSVMGPLQQVVSYAIQIIKKMQNENIKYWVPRQDVTDEFNKHAQSWFKGTVWEEDCNAWYKDRKTGIVTAVWPGSGLHYMEAISEPRYEDMDIKYHGQNRFAHLGLGFVERDLDKNMDKSPYLDLKFLDPRYYE